MKHGIFITITITVVIVTSAALLRCSSGGAARTLPRPGKCIDIARVWSGHPVEFDLLTHSNLQFVAFYGTDRWLTIAARRLDSRGWDFARLPSQLGWDSHNYVTVAIDKEGFIHVSGNMHNVPLNYFRTINPLDITSFVRCAAMVGKNENKCTQPKFLHASDRQLVFTYRDGGSGNGIRLYNTYDTETREWRRLLDKPLLSGEGKMNAYPVGPVHGPDGWFHLVWVWRDTPDCSSNHDLSYARSKDLMNWETSSGKKLSLPITITNGEIIVPIPVRSGLLNGHTVIGFDSKDRPVVSYYRFDKNGNTQLYNVRLENGTWKIYQTNDWNYRWDFHGWGCIVEQIEIWPVTLTADNSLIQSFKHKVYGENKWQLDHETLKPISQVAETMHPAELEAPVSQFPGMKVQWWKGRGEDSSDGSKYWLRWETLEENRDKAREGLLPPPSMLKLYSFY